MRLQRNGFGFVPLTSAVLLFRVPDINRPMHLRLLPEKGKYKFRGGKMEMLVTKFSNGKYKNELELFEEPISKENGAKGIDITEI